MQFHLTMPPPRGRQNRGQTNLSQCAAFCAAWTDPSVPGFACRATIDRAKRKSYTNAPCTIPDGVRTNPSPSATHDLEKQLRTVERRAALVRGPAHRLRERGSDRKEHDHRAAGNLGVG